MSILDNEQVKIKCQRFTPYETVIEMLQMAKYGVNNNIIGKKFLDNSFGSGNVLVEAVKYYITACEKAGISPAVIAEMLHRDIYGVELDEELHTQCLTRLNAIADNHNLPQVSWNLICTDALRWETEDQFDFIIGNPPYVAYREIDEQNRKYLQENYKSCGRGKFDYCYAFIEKALRILSEDGILVQLVPNNIYKNVFAEDLRSMLCTHITQIDIFPSQNLFEEVLTSTSIFVYEANAQPDEIICRDNTSKHEYHIKRSNLKGKWVFSEANHSLATTYRFGDYFNASSAVATLLNEAFILSQETLNAEEIEKDIIRPAVSPKAMRLKRTEYIIFPYFYDDGKLCHIAPESFEEKYPKAAHYLRTFSDKLQARKSDKSAYWFEYGRSQALQHLNQEKLLLSTVITNAVEVYRIDCEGIPYTGIYVTPIRDKSIDFAEKILKSRDFMEYIKGIGISVNGKSMRITCSDVNNYRFKMEDPAWKN